MFAPTQDSAARHASGVRAAAKRATDALKQLAMRPVSFSVIRPFQRPSFASVGPRVSMMQGTGFPCMHLPCDSGTELVSLPRVGHFLLW